MVHPEGTIQHQMLDVMADWGDQLNANSASIMDPF